VVHGSCTAGGAYVPAMSDHAVIVRNQGRVFLGGPPAGEGRQPAKRSMRSPWAAADVHCRRSGVTDYYAEERHALRWRFARRAVARLRPAAMRSGGGTASAGEPAYDPAELYGIIPPSSRKPYDVRELIARLADRSWFDEFKALYGTNLGLRLLPTSNGSTVGILANKRHSILRESALKGTHFIELCCREGIPLVFSAEHRRLHGGPGRGGAGGNRQGWCQAGHGPWPARRCRSTTVVIGGSLRRRQTMPCAGRGLRSAIFYFSGRTARTFGHGRRAGRPAVLATIKREALERGGGTLSDAEGGGG